MVTNCKHCFCEVCLATWEQGQVRKGAVVTCPHCQQPIESYLPFEWPLFIANFREELVTKLRAIERDKATLMQEKRVAEEQLLKDRKKQTQLQQTLNEFRTVTVKKNEETLRKNEDDIAKLRKQIGEKQKLLGRAGQAAEEQKRQEAELERAREQMAGLEATSSELQGELHRKQSELEALQGAVGAGERALAAKQAELEALQHEAEGLAALEQQEVPLTPGSGSAARLGAVLKGAALGSSYYLSRGYRYLRTNLWAGPPHGLLRSVGDYQTRERRGAHRQSPVWRAEDLQQNQWAVKWRRVGGVEGAYREAMLLGTLSHPHVLPLQGLMQQHDDDDDNNAGAVGLLFSFVALDLQYVLAPDTAAAPLGVGAQTSVFQALLSALAYAHAQEVVHRSISPAAVLLGDFDRQDEDRTILLGSWTEAASLASPVPVPLVSRGGARYRAPEYLLGVVASVDWKAFDVWAAGCVAWELLLENSCTSIMQSTSRDLRDQLRSLFVWTELHEQATVWLDQQENHSSDYPVLEQVLVEKPNYSRQSMLAVLQDPQKMIAPEAAQMVLRMLSWDPRKRPSAANLLASKYFAGGQEPPRGRDLEPGSLSDAALKEWIRVYVEK